MPVKGRASRPQNLDIHHSQNNGLTLHHTPGPVQIRLDEQATLIGIESCHVLVWLTPGRNIETGPPPGNVGQFGSSSRVVGRQRSTPQPHRRGLLKAKQRMAQVH
jgi:hypothetical protein